jgi:HlyB family type I secretion system ABC transporter
MVQISSDLSKPQIAQFLVQAIGVTPSEADLAHCLRHMETLEPASAKKFWSAQAAAVGIYIVLTGKVRLLDHTDNLIASGGVGTTFGQLSFFPEQSFQPYAARASVNLQLGYFSAQSLNRLIRDYPAIREHLYQQAALRDLLLLCRQSPVLREAPLEAVSKVLPLFKRHELPASQLPVWLINAQRLWLLRQGELLHNSGKRLLPGQLYAPQSLEEGSWQATQSAELYSLSCADWANAIDDLPQLAQLGAVNLGATANSQNLGFEPRLEIPPPSAQPKPPRSQISRAYFPHPSLAIGHLWQRLTRRYPFFEQQSAADCGAACLVMVGRYWGKRFSVNRLRDIANVNRSGASLRGLATAAESLGFTTRPVKASLNKLAEQGLPAIAHWEGKHYIVVYEVTHNSVVVGDPAIGQLTLSPAQFKAGWKGYTLLLQPTALLKQAEEDNPGFWQFFELAKPHRLVLLEVFATSVLLQIFGLITPLFTQLLLDRVIVQRSTLTLTAVGIGLLIFGMFRVITAGLRQYLLDHTANRVDLALIVGFISHTFKLPLSFFESRFVGDIISRVQENRKIQRFITGEALSIILDLLTVFVYLGLMFWYSWKLALLSLVIIPPFVLLALIATPFLQRVSRQIFNAYTEETGYLIQSLTGIHTVKSMAVEQTVRWHWEELFGKSLKKTFSGQIIGNTLLMFSGTIETIVTTGLLWFGAWQVIQNELTIGQLVAFNMLLGNVINPFRRLTVLWNELQEVMIAIERINDVIETEPEEDLQLQIRQTLPPIQGHLHFQQVTFRYHPDSDVNTLENISFQVYPGQMVALVGRSGSGKTTLSKLILGLYPPTEGQILIDGYDVTCLNLRSLRQQIGVVDQDTFLFGATIRENISLGHPEATLEDVIEAAQQAGAHSFIKELPLGYETQIGEGGGMLSGGQRQRLAIARALLGDPRLLIFDEATSHLDAESERIIQTNLSSILRQRTTLVIAHRLSTVRHADQILVLDKGILIESGTHEQLMQTRGHYFYLNQQQLAITS